MTKRIKIAMVRMYQVIDNDTDEIIAETLDRDDAESLAGHDNA